MKEIWLVEVNVNYDKQDNPYTWHLSTLQGTIDSNVKNIYAGISNNTWYIVGYADTYDEASKICDRLRKLLENEHKAQLQT